MDPSRLPSRVRGRLGAEPGLRAIGAVADYSSLVSQSTEGVNVLDHMRGHARSRGTIIVLVALGVALTACGSGSATARNKGTATQTEASNRPASRLLTPAAFEAAVAQPDRVTINVHIPFVGAISGTDEFLPYNQIPAEASQLPAARSTPLAVYCRSGRMSAMAVRELAARGYYDIVELSGGMEAWTASGRSLLSTRAPS